MRVTNRLLIDSVTSNLFRNTEQLLKIENMISSGKRINLPSDDPVGMSKVLGYRKTISSIKQYGRNITHGESWASHTDSVLGNADMLLIRAKELAVYQATETATEETREMAAEDIRNIYEQLTQLANSKVEGSYIFAGHRTDTAPFSSGGEIDLVSPAPVDMTYGLIADASDVTIEIRDDSGAVVRTIIPPGGGISGLNTVTWDGLDDSSNPCPDGRYSFTVTASDNGIDVSEFASYNGDNGRIRIILGENMDMEINASGEDVFQGNTVEIFRVLKQLEVALEDNDTSAISDQIVLLDDSLNQVLKVRSEMGAKLNRLEVTENYWEKFKLNVTEMLSDTEDVDFAEAMTELMAQEAAYQASLGATARIIQPSLINFLR